MVEAEQEIKDEKHLYMIVGEIRSDVKTLLGQLPDYDKRLRHLERKQWWLTGAGAVCAALAVKIGLPDIAQYFMH